MIITYDNYKQYINKPVEVEITCYAFGMMYPQENVLIGMNPDYYYFYSEEEEVYWHWETNKENKDSKTDCHIEVYLKS